MQHSIAALGGRLFGALGATLIAVGCLAAQAAPAQSKRPVLRAYKATLLLDPASQTQFFGQDLNALGQVGGNINRADLSGSQAAIWRNGKVTPLPELEGTVSSSVLAMNDLGDAVGLDTTAQANGVFWHRGTVQSMGTPDPAGYFFPTRLNNRGQAIGFTGLNYYLWQAGRFTPLEPGPGARNAVAEDINFAGHVAGWDVDTEATTRAVLWRDGMVESLGSLPGMTDTQAKGLNDLDHVVGVSLNWRTGVERAFLWRQGDLQELPLINPADDESSVALSVNVWGQVVGNEQPANSGETVAVLWERNRALDLNTLVRSAHFLDSHITLRSAFLINEWGQILVYAQDDRVENADFYYLLTPTVNLSGGSSGN